MTLPDGAILHFSERIDFYVRGTQREYDVEVVFVDDLDSLLLFCDAANRVYADAGGGFVLLPQMDPDAGLELGPGTAGQRKPVTIRYSTSDDLRDDFPQLLMDGGI